MTNGARDSSFRLAEADLECIRRFMLTAGGDIAEAMGRGFERLEERIDALERLCERHADSPLIVSELG